jgi:hypothetical protein
LIKKLVITLLITVAAVLFWFSFAIWTGLYSVFTIPPSKANPDGTTLIVSRDEGEPMFNSPQYKKPQAKKAEKTTGIGFGGSERPKRPIDKRIIVELPYLEWAYEKSLEEPEQQ